MPLTARQERIWGVARVGFCATTAALWVFALGSPVVWGTDSEPAAWGAVVLVMVAVMTPWLVLPISALPSMLLTMDTERLLVPTYRRLVHIDLSALKFVGARSLPGKTGAVAFLSLRDERGARAVLLWDSVPAGISELVVAAVKASPNAGVTPRARFMLRMPDAPKFSQRVLLAAKTGFGWLGFVAILFLFVVRVWGGSWPWDIS